MAREGEGEIGKMQIAERKGGARVFAEREGNRASAIIIYLTQNPNQH